MLEGTLSKWTNVMKGWQYRWFVLDENAGLLSYYTVSILLFYNIYILPPYTTRPYFSEELHLTIRHEKNIKLFGLLLILIIIRWGQQYCHEKCECHFG